MTYKPYLSFEQWSLSAREKHNRAFMERAEEFLEVLRSLSGNGVKYRISGLRRLVRRSPISESTVRKMLRYLRHEGHPICSDRGGYWYSENPDDISATIMQLADREYGVRFTKECLRRYLRSRRR